jgi:hypothetical protein
VFTSYILQCGIVLLIALGFAITALLSLRRKADNRNSKIVKRKEALISGLVEFHKAQCYFSSTIQIASLASGIFSINVLNNFLLLPLATNGLLPVVLAYVMIIRYGRSSTYLTILTLMTWILATLVLWTLYRKLIPVDWSKSDQANSQIYYQFMFDLSANPSCGGSSALAVCPESLVLGLDKVLAAARRIHGFTPFLWTWSTLCLGIILVLHYLPKRWRTKKPQWISDMSQNFLKQRGGIRLDFVRKALTMDGLFWLSVLVFTVALGLQLSLLSIDASLDLMDPKAWSFGQIVAVTIWAAPIAEYFYLLTCEFTLFKQKSCSTKRNQIHNQYVVIR